MRELDMLEIFDRTSNHSLRASPRRSIERLSGRKSIERSLAKSPGKHSLDSRKSSSRLKLPKIKT